MKKYLLGSALILTLGFGCSDKNNQAQTEISSIPTPVPAVAGSVYMRAKAEFDVTSSPSGSTRYELVKKSYASNCVNNICTDVSDVSVVNNSLTQFSLIPAQHNAAISSTANNATIQLVELQVGTLFDNDLHSCGGSKCTAANIQVYTTSINAGPGLYNSVTGQSVPLMISGGILASAQPIPYNPTQSSSLVVDQALIVTGEEIVELNQPGYPNQFSNAGVNAGYLISADFSQAGSGNYSAHVVVEYDLVGSGVVVSGPSDVYVAGYDSTGIGAYWINGIKTPIPDAQFLQSINVSGSDVYLGGFDTSNKAAIWKNGVKTQLSGGGFVFSTFLSGSTLYATGQDGANNAVEWVVDWNSNGAVTTNISTQLDTGGYGASIFVSNGTVYVAGSNAHSKPTLWTGTSPTILSQILGAGTSAYVSGVHVYVAFYASNSGYIWKDGTATQLPNNGMSSVPNSIFVNGSNVYATGNDDNHPVVWKNNVELSVLDQGNGGTGYGIAVSSDDADVYVSGYSSSGHACYWKNGTKFDLDAVGGSAQAIVLVSH